MKKFLLLIVIVTAVSACGRIAELPEDLKNTGQSTLATLSEKSDVFRENLITTIQGVEVTALPYLEVIEEEVSGVLKSLRKGESASDDLSQCLQDRGLVYYTSSTCNFATQQKILLGNNYTSFDRVLCDPQNDLAACIKAGVQGTPAWGIPASNTYGKQRDAKLIHGVKTLEDLAREFNCN